MEQKGEKGWAKGYYPAKKRQKQTLEDNEEKEQMRMQRTFGLDIEKRNKLGLT